ncbi:MAG: glutamine-hydrolyzing GMP synthase [Ferrimicrobium sp.]|uniref:GMP synthase [glutamine-hydrolyzing] n=1 Tax=Ferrimicrobium acidiphilum TaxID=121039 RepID=A0ABV3XYV5_9ACTN|nr:glutamine-hydrolyzing GMP synthase [Ferrimicrobium sp.]MCL5973929.1 glutamine-hydrolyzing GMP synthase [Actinomycetota bacterium]
MESSRESPVVVVDFGAQYAQLIARRVRELHVYSEIVAHTVTAAELRARGARAVILSGGPKSVYVAGAPTIDPEIFAMGLPILGICYGAQLMALALGGRVERTEVGEYGRTAIRQTSTAGMLLAELPDSFASWMSHQDTIMAPPAGALVTATTEQSVVASFEDAEQRRYGVQFHPEVSHGEFGREVLHNFLFRAAKLEPKWTNFSIIEESITQIRSQVGERNVLCALSGGVDSTVAAVLTHEAVGDQLTCVFVDTGLLREGEADQVVSLFSSQFHIKLVVIDAASQFLSSLAGVLDPELKRKTIGNLFIRTFEEAARDIDAGGFLVQGTLYPDVIESGSGSAALIKSHHNVGGLPDDMSFALVEPLRFLFKDEVRAIGVELGIPEEMVWRQPFPGPGLAVRIVGEVTEEAVGRVRAADRIVREEVVRAGLARSMWQYFAVLAPSLRSVGVSGDERTYDAPIIVRCVDSDDAMTADWARIPYEILDTIAHRIVGEVDGVNRVVYDITSKPPGTIEWE